MFPHPRARSVAVASLSVAIAVAVVARGGVDASTQGLLVVASGVALLAATSVSTAQFRAPALLVALGLALAVTALQLVPLPPAILASLSPGARDVAEVSLAPLGLYPSARPLTLDVPATAGEVGKGAALLMAATAAVLLGTHRASRDTLVAAVSASGVVAVAVAAGRALSGGPFEPNGGTFVNPNHLAALLALATWPALGRALREAGRVRTAWLAASAVMAMGTFLTLSRAGIAAFFVGATTFAALYLGRELRARDTAGRSPLARAPARAALPVAMALVVAVAAGLAVPRMGEELRTISRVASDPRAEVWPAALELLEDHPLTGIGRGAFTVAFAGHRPPGTELLTHTHVENEWLQLPLDLGVPAGVAVIAALAWAWISAARRRDLSRVEIGVLAGTAAVAAHAVVDFALELPGVALPFAVLLGLVQASARGFTLAPRTFRRAAVGLAAAGAAGLLVAAARPAERTEALGAVPLEDVPDLARSLARWRPADWVPHAAAGARLAQAGRCAEAMPWLTRAMWLAPSMPEAHRHAARCLAAARQDRLARGEYRLASMLGDASALEEAARRWSGADALRELVPDTAEAIWRLAQVLERIGRRAEAADLLERASRDLSDPGLLFALGHARSRLGEHDRTLDAARALRELEPDGARSYVLASLALARMGDGAGALQELEAGRARLPGSPEILLAEGAELVRQRRFAQATQVLGRGEWRSAHEAANARALVIAALRSQGRLAEAIAEARIGRELEPRSGAAAIRLADLLAEAGLHDEAIHVLSGAAAAGVDPTAMAARIERLRARRDAPPR